MNKQEAELQKKAAEVVVASAFRRQVIFWLVAAAVLIGFLYLFSAILLPFFAGMILAYFLDPVADWLERRGLSRMAATVLILIMFLYVGAVLAQQTPSRSEKLRSRTLGDSPPHVPPPRFVRWRPSKQNVSHTRTW